MGFFSETVAAHLAGREIGAALLVHMDFRENERRWWTGNGTLNAGGHDWQGTGTLISIEGLEQPLGTAAPKTTFTVSGVDATMVQMARQASDRVKGRRARAFIQFFDAVTLAKLDTPYAIWSGEMDQMRYAAEGPQSRTITLTAESLWTNRRIPPYGMYTDRDQNARFPGDRGLEQVVNLVAKTIRWPVFVIWLLAGVLMAYFAPVLYPLIPQGEA